MEQRSNNKGKQQNKGQTTKSTTNHPTNEPTDKSTNHHPTTTCLTIQGLSYLHQTRTIEVGEITILFLRAI
tara:strand:- start:962 stop:1174 length:213 start_codon:yes stop_codon:yes gene_type:complete